MRIVHLDCFQADTLCQWCTTFFCRGPLIDLLNPSGAKQVSQPWSGECLSKCMKMMCTVKHMVNINRALSGSISVKVQSEFKKLQVKRESVIFQFHSPPLKATKRLTETELQSRPFYKPATLPL